MGILFYVVGASGAGKDSLMQYAREKIGGAEPVFFAHRYITRSPESGGENHVSVSIAEFDRMETLGLFALNWDSHGNRYGLGREIDLWLEAGANVVMNGSRGYLAEASGRYLSLCVVLVEVSPVVLRARLERRARETPSEIEQRLARAAEFTVEHPNLVRFSNDGSIEEAGDAFVSLLTGAPVSNDG